MPKKQVTTNAGIYIYLSIIDVQARVSPDYDVLHYSPPSPMLLVASSDKQAVA
jgi:hypothetical protein